MNDDDKRLTERERASRAAYFRAWRAANKQRVKEYNVRYWQKRAAAEQTEEMNDED